MLKEIKPRGLVFINLADIHLALCMYAARILIYEPRLLCIRSHRLARLLSANYINTARN